MNLRNLYIVAIIFVSTFGNLHAQKEYNMWYFGNGAGLDFNTTPPSVLNNSKLHAFEGTTSICDSNGQLLFYSNGDTIFNRNHQLMFNSSSSMPYAKVGSAVQSCLALPVPGSKNLYYLFLGLSRENTFGLNQDSMLRYWVIDMDKDGGMGEVTMRDEPLIPGRLENFAVTLHSNEKDYWVASTDVVNSTFNCIRTTNGQFTTTPLSQKLDIKSNNLWGNNKFSPDSRIFFSKETMKKNKSYLNLYKFNNANGQISQPICIQVKTDVYYTEFSSDSRFLYVPTLDSLKFSLFQYDLSVWDSTAIESSKQIVHSYIINMNAFPYVGGLQLGPDGKIYYFHNSNYPPYLNSKVSVINQPDKKGTACNFSFKSIDLNNVTNNFGGPYYPSFWFRTKKISIGRDTLICEGDKLNITCKANPNSIILWSTGAVGKSIIVTKQGIYSVKVTSPSGNVQFDTIVVKIGPKFKVFIGNDTAFCHQFSHLLKASPGFAKYNWNTGSNNMQITVNSKGIYSVKVLDSNSCPSGDTIAIDEIKKPIIKISYDSLNCKYVYLTSDSIKGLSYLWNTGETKNAIKVSKKGWYSITARHQFCSNTDSILVDKLAMPEIDLGADTSLCLNEIILKMKEQGIYLWNTGQKTPSIIVNQPGKYWLTVTRNNCSTTDTVEVKLCEDMLVYIPDVFSPNADGINDVFKIYGSNIIYAELEIYNRWGEKLLQTNVNEAQWDGTYKNEMCMEAVYFYKVKIKGKKLGSMKYLSGSITLLK